jgi:putative methyltransferase
VVDRQAAHAVGALLRADETGAGGASIKSLTLGPAVAAKKATYAVTCETLRLLPVIRQAVGAAGLLPAHALLAPATAYVLCYEALFGEGLRQKGPAEHAVLGALPALRARLAALQEAAGVEDARQLVAGGQAERAALRGRRRAARVNTLKMSVAEALSWLRHPPTPHAAHAHKVLATSAQGSCCMLRLTACPAVRGWERAASGC